MTAPTYGEHHLAGNCTAVYRFYDANDRLLYIGITHDVEERWATHERIQPWWLDVTRREFAWYSSRAEAKVIEDIATATESPRYDRANQRTTSGEVEQRLEAETVKAMEAVAADISNGTYPLWRVLPSYPALSERYQIPMIGIAHGLARLANRDRVLVYHHDQFAVSRPDCVPSRDAQQVGLLYFLACNAFGASPFTLNELAGTTGFTKGTSHQHVRRWQKAGRAESVGRVDGGRAFLYRITRHPDPDPPKVLTYWSRDDVLALAEWLGEQIDADATATAGRDREIIKACLTTEYSVSTGVVRVLQVMAREYADRPGCLPEWGITTN